MVSDTQLKLVVILISQVIIHLHTRKLHHWLFNDMCYPTIALLQKYYKDYKQVAIVYFNYIALANLAYA